MYAVYCPHRCCFCRLCAFVCANVSQSALALKPQPSHAHDAHLCWAQMHLANVYTFGTFKLNLLSN